MSNTIKNKLGDKILHYDRKITISTPHTKKENMYTHISNI